MNHISGNLVPTIPAAESNNHHTNSTETRLRHASAIPTELHRNPRMLQDKSTKLFE
jgi:hypothetical protein